MLPRVFVSSTVDDLHHLRDGIREAILELEYIPVMSEYGEIGYLPDRSAEQSCYSEVEQTDVAVLLIGKRYGQLATGGLSVTHNEFRTARDKRLPVFTLVDREVLSYKKIYDANQTLGATFPGVDEPARLFSLLEEIRQYPSNNGFITYLTVAEARTQLKKQIAHYVGDVIRSASGPALDLKDVLAEIKTLRHETMSVKDKEGLKPFLIVMRRLLSREERATKTLASVLERTFDDLDSAAAAVLDSKKVEELFKKAKYELIIDDSVNPFDRSLKPIYSGAFLDPSFQGPLGKAPVDPAYVGNFMVTADRVIVNKAAHRVFAAGFQELKQPPK